MPVFTCSLLGCQDATELLRIAGRCSTGPGQCSVGVAAGLGRGHQARETAVQTVNLCALVHLGSRGVG